MVPSGCSAATLACRLMAAHRTSTGQLAGLHEDVAAGAKLLRDLLSASSQRPQQQPQSTSMNDEEQDGPCSGAADAVTPGMLQSLSASMGNAGERHGHSNCGCQRARICCRMAQHACVRKAY